MFGFSEKDVKEIKKQQLILMPVLHSDVPNVPKDHLLDPRSCLIGFKDLMITILCPLHYGPIIEHGWFSCPSYAVYEAFFVKVFRLGFEIVIEPLLS